jgi:membrane-bound lytic murein transglycosylase D
LERAASSERPVVVLPALPFSFPDRTRWFYRVNRHDELETLASRLGLPAADLALWNDLDPKLPLRVSSMLTVWLPAAFVSEGIQLWPESAVEIARPDAAAATAAPKRARASEPKPARHTRKTHAVKAGETLSSIARRFRVRVADLRRWNDLDEDEIILVGQPLLVGR